MNKANKLQISSLVLQTAKCFQGRPSSDFLSNVVKYVHSLNVTIKSAEMVFHKFPQQYDRFPSVRQIQEAFDGLRRAEDEEHVDVTAVWSSTRAPGTPACVEALFNQIEAGTTDSGSFKYGLQWCGLSEEQLFAAYEFFLRGEVMEDIRPLVRKKIA